MLAFLEGIADFISGVVNFVVSIIQGLYRMIQYVGIALQTLGSVMTYIPTDLAVLAAAFISVAVVYLIIGREG